MNTYVDVETGELLNGILVTQEELKKKKNRNDFIQYQKSQDSLAVYIDDQFGSFYFNNYKKLLEKVDNDTALAFRFLYLCTFADYDNYLHDEDGLMSEKDLGYILKLAPTAFFSLKKQLYDKHLIFKDKMGFLKINSLYYTRGKINAGFKQESSRVFDNGIRTLYKTAKSKDHKRIGTIIPLLIYTNSYINVLCHNTQERDTDKINALTLHEISEIIGYSYDHVSSLTNYLKNIKVNNKPLMARVTHSDGDFYIINPAVFYKGNKIDDLIQIENMFNIKNT